VAGAALFSYLSGQGVPVDYQPFRSSEKALRWTLEGKVDQCTTTGHRRMTTGHEAEKVVADSGVAPGAGLMGQFPGSRFGCPSFLSISLPAFFRASWTRESFLGSPASSLRTNSIRNVAFMSLLWCEVPEMRIWGTLSGLIESSPPIKEPT